MAGEKREIDPTSEEGLDETLRQMIGVALQSGMSPQTVEELLRHHADGVEYYWSDMERYGRPDGED